MRAATNDYLSDEDVLAQFTEVAIEPAPGELALTDDLHQSYQQWTHKRGERPFGLKRFSQALEDKGYVRGQHNQTRRRGFRDIRLKVLTSDESTDS